MIIRCPQCQFEREIAADAIPATAVMATCPRCGTRFQFRKLERTAPPANTEEPAPSVPVAPAAAPVDAPASQAGDDPLPPGAVVPERAEDAPRQTAPAGAEKSAGTGVAPAAPAGENAASRPARRLRRAAADEAPRGGDVPWEAPETYGLFGGLYQTILRVMFQPPRFFAVLDDCRGGVGRAVAFYVLLGMFQTCVKLFWIQQSLAPAMTDPKVQQMVSAMEMSTPLALLVAPALLFVQLYFYAALFALMLRLVQPDQVRFATVLRVVAYSAAPLVVCAVPGIGPLVGSIWFAACCFVGCRFALNLNWAKVGLALGPLYAIAFAVAMQFIQHISALG